MTISYRLVRQSFDKDRVLDAAQLQVAGHRRGVTLVLGGPRTGKTTALVEASVGALEAGASRVIFLAGSRPARLEVRAKAGVRAPELVGRLAVTTFYSFCQSVVQTYAEPGQVPAVLSAARQDSYIRDLVLGQPADAWPERFRLARRTVQFAASVREAVAACQRAGLSGQDVVAQGTEAQRDDWVSLGRFFQEYLDVLGMSAKLDYPEILVRAAGLLRQESVRAEVSPPGCMVVVDGVEDMDAAQIEVLDALVDASVPTILAADPDAQVYGFRGARPRSAGEMLQQWSGRGLDTRVVVLAQGHRVAAQVDLACSQFRRRIPLPAGIDVADLTRYRSPVPDCEGEVIRLLVSDGVAEADQIARILRHAHVLDEVAFEDMAILVRKTSQFSRYALACEQAGVPVVVSGDEIQLSREPIVTWLLDLVKLSVQDAAGVEEESGYLDSGENQAGDSNQDLGREESQGGSGGAGHGDGGGRLDPNAPIHGCCATPAIGGFRCDRDEGTVRQAPTGQRVADVLWQVWKESGLQETLMAEAEGSGPEALRAHHGLDAVMELFTVASAFSDLPADKGTHALLEAVANQEIPEDLPRSSSWTASAVRLTTAHRAKGRTWSVVVVAGVEEGVWPLDPPPPPMVSVNGLVPASMDDREIVVAERKLLYAACSSASHRLVVTAVDDGERCPSSFFDQIVAETRRLDSSPPAEWMSASEVVGRLRYVAADETADPGLRQAACDRLARLSQSPVFPGCDPREWWGIDPSLRVDLGLPIGVDRLIGADSGPGHVSDSALSPQPVTLSASQVESLLACPRRWFLSHQALADRPQSARTRIGSALHALIQDPDAGLEQMVENLRARWDEIEFPAEWMRRTEFDQACLCLERFDALNRARSREVLAREASVAVDLVSGGPVRVQGRIDTVERDDASRVWIVDFKTGQQLPTRAQAAANIQLGLYQLAALAGGLVVVDSEHSAVAGAELVYLSKEAGKGSRLPKVLAQESLQQVPHLGDEPVMPILSTHLAEGIRDPRQYPTWVHHRVAIAASIVRSGDYSPVAGPDCRTCSFTHGCPIAAEGRVRS
ncbi:MAG: ATP-dependent helicase [Propionibacteriaceae bacterium]|nr:ATP-dependent helicase [Propionibacteriaceae bacterium]